MRGGGVGAEGGIGSGGEVFCSMQFLTSIDHGGCRRPTAAMWPHSWRGSMQQSANKLGNRLLSLKLEKVISNNVYWLVQGTMRRQIIVPDVHRLRWPCRRCRASHICVVYVSLHGRHARFAMLAMFGALAAEVQ
jgi:hypothetical protein